MALKRAALAEERERGAAELVGRPTNQPADHGNRSTAATLQRQQQQQQRRCKLWLELSRAASSSGDGTKELNCP